MRSGCTTTSRTAKGDKQRFIDHLYIEPSLPAGALEGPHAAVQPALENWRRKAKVPMLILNATSLNTGHAWQFTASWMGEPATHDQTMNATPPLRRLRYSEAPSAHRHVRLGHAVAASACVPGLFEPVVLDQLYEGGITVRLVDGGAFDNQGVASLLAENCTVLLVSDASGQIRLTDQPAGDPLAVALRSNDVLMARVRETQYHIASRLQRSGVLRGFMYVHLRDGLSAPPVDWIGCTDRPDAAAMVEPTQLTEYGMRTDVQRCLAELRTDLDAFSELEASALMESGYRATKYRLPSSVPPALLDGGEPAAGSNTAYAAKAEAWQFHTAVPLVATIDQPVERYQKAVRYLERGAIRMGRTLPLMPGAETIKRRALYAGLASVVLLVVGLVLDWRVTLASIGISPWLALPSAQSPSSCSDCRVTPPPTGSGLSAGSSVGSLGGGRSGSWRSEPRATCRMARSKGSSSLERSRRTFLSNLPTLVLGTASMKTTRSGSHHLATRGVRYSRMSSAVSWPANSGLGTTQARGAPPRWGGAPRSPRPRAPSGGP
jgi:hypothetical protein